MQRQENKKQSSKKLCPMSMASGQYQKHTTTTTEICQTKGHHSKLGQKICEMTNKAFKGHGGTNASSKTQTHCYTQTQTQHHEDQRVAKTEITLYVVQAHITQTHAPYARGTTTTCFGNHTKKNRDHNNKQDRNIFRRIRDGVSHHNSNSDSDSSSEKDSDNENCPTRKN